MATQVRKTLGKGKNHLQGKQNFLIVFLEIIVSKMSRHYAYYLLSKHEFRRQIIWKNIADVFWNFVYVLQEEEKSLFSICSQTL